MRARRSNAAHEPDLFGLRESPQHATNIVSRRVKQDSRKHSCECLDALRSTLHLPEQSLCVGGSQEKVATHHVLNYSKALLRRGQRVSDPPAKAIKVIGGDELRPSGRALVGDIVHLEDAVCGHVVRPADGQRILPHAVPLVFHVDDALPSVALR